MLSAPRSNPKRAAPRFFLGSLAGVPGPEPAGVPSPAVRWSRPSPHRPVHQIGRHLGRRIGLAGRGLFGAGLLGVALLGCSGASGESDWARATAQTCASTLARTGFDAPSPDPVDPARFLAERRRLLGERIGFNTVSPFRTVCSDIRNELTAAGNSPESTLPAP